MRSLSPSVVENGQREPTVRFKFSLKTGRLKIFLEDKEILRGMIWAFRGSPLPRSIVEISYPVSDAKARESLTAAQALVSSETLRLLLSEPGLCSEDTLDLWTIELYAAAFEEKVAMFVDGVGDAVVLAKHEWWRRREVRRRCKQLADDLSGPLFS